MISAEKTTPPARTASEAWSRPRTESAGCVLSAVAASVPVLRRFASRLIRLWCLPEAVEEAVTLVVTELVTNAVRHSGSADVALVMATAEGRLTIRVRDYGLWRPRDPRPADDEACGGRGLDLVDAFAVTCEVLSTASGTQVTAEIALPT
ncbi:ATP-binding protein [Kitasatospora sp. NBC_00240]|uniref:ATP-binding protein n=1 Tax=Kitasatospora sp. NBC_00240 TaxID=2903567 RepID=UPI00225A92E1|nr:ATP-binding protein [Kitasatospora sp. NBC_00240]MCX5208422.1 ATP-binding protein [Kitasatospora sp. NBC_00240]